MVLGEWKASHNHTQVPVSVIFYVTVGDDGEVRLAQHVFKVFDTLRCPPAAGIPHDLSGADPVRCRPGRLEGRIGVIMAFNGTRP